MGRPGQAGRHRLQRGRPRRPRRRAPGGRLDIADVSQAVEEAGTGISTSAASDAAASAESRTYAQVQSIPGSPCTGLRSGLPGAHPERRQRPAGRPDLRRAVAEAVDRQRIADAVLPRSACPPSRWATSGDGRPERLPGRQRRAHPRPGERRPAAGADGWQLPAKGGVARAKAGHQLSLRLVTRAGSAVDAQVAALVTGQLARVGVPVTTEAVPAASFFTDRINPGRYDLALFSWPASAFPVADEPPLYAKPQAGPDGEALNGANLAGTGTQEIDQLLAQAEGRWTPVPPPGWGSGGHPDLGAGPLAPAVPAPAAGGRAGHRQQCRGLRLRRPQIPRPGLHPAAGHCGGRPRRAEP
ncbi:hypothetical protein GXW82_28425 [Streptacidiphilus sp. 4-A2]|nr:hypothetical protein [Streptacidiphilus sp. 4-A2]